ncbi:hypothetical protein G9A89_004409 [Geosiphon pyriformis]|nr:hypothetical protein G9A89_004409 [Geosiphon pyriformis]
MPDYNNALRSEDHYYDLSQTAALIYYLYHRLAGHDLVALNADNPELEERWSYLSESPVVAPFHTALQLSNGMWSLHTKLIPEFVIEDSKPHEPPIDFAFWRILVGALIFPFYGFVTIPVTIFVCVAFYIPILLRSEIVLWRAFWKLDRWCKFVSFLAILVATIALIPLIIAMDLLILGAVVLVSFYPMYQAVTESTAAGCQASLDVARQIIRRYMEVAVPGSARTSSIEGSELDQKLSEPFSKTGIDRMRGMNEIFINKEKNQFFKREFQEHTYHLQDSNYKLASRNSEKNVRDIPSLINNHRTIRNFGKVAEYANRAYCSSHQKLLRFSKYIQGNSELEVSNIVLFFRAPEIQDNELLFSKDRLNGLEIYPGVIGPLKTRVKVDTNFFAMYNQAKNEILRVLGGKISVESPNKGLILTGHRLAGVIAIFAAIDFKKIYPQKEITVFTWGSPRMGNLEFAQYYNLMKKFKMEIWIKNAGCECGTKIKDEIYSCKGRMDKFLVLQGENLHDFTYDGPYFGTTFKICSPKDGKSFLNSNISKNSKFELIAEDLKSVREFQPEAVQDPLIKANFKRFAWYTNKAYCSPSEIAQFLKLKLGKMEITSKVTVMYFRAPEIHKNWKLFSHDRLNRLEIYPGMIGPLKGKVKVDAKFFAIYQEAENEIVNHFVNETQATSHKNEIVNFTGHRLAGVIALFSALKFKKLNPNKKVTVFTWGSPRMGNRSFAQYMDTISGLRIFRFTLFDDMIPRFPQRRQSYMHYETEYWIGKIECDCDEQIQTYKCKGIVDEFGVLIDENKQCLNNQDVRYRHDFTYDGSYFGITFKDCPKMDQMKYR